jgi:hypothetical protein
MASYREFETVVLARDLPEAGLRAGDLGTVVQVYGADALEVEFVTAAGRTRALETLRAADVRPVADDDLLAVRPSGGMRGAA